MVSRKIYQLMITVSMSPRHVSERVLTVVISDKVKATDDLVRRTNVATEGGVEVIDTFANK